MKKGNRALMLEALESPSYKRRLNRAHRFEQVSGGGTIKRIQHLFAAPSIYLPYLFYAKAGMSRRFLTPTTLFWGRKVDILLQDYDALILYMYGGLGGPYGAELPFTKFIIKNLGPDDVFYDVGANYGFYTYLAADLCKETHSFEPVSRLADVVRKNIRKGDVVVANAVALSDKKGALDFYTMESTMLSTLNESVAKLHSSHTDFSFKKVTVPTTTIDDYVATNAKPTFLKIDAEGAEEQIIKGGSNFFSSNAPMVAMEIWGKENKWELSMKAADALRNMGYKSFRIDKEGGFQEVTGDLSGLVTPDGGENFVFKK